jgi:hypothetical protein
MSIKNQTFLIALTSTAIAIYTALLGPSSAKMATVVGLLLLTLIFFYQVAFVVISLGFPNIRGSKKIIAFFISVALTYLLALKSLSKLGYLDVLFTVLSATIVCWYVNKTVK